MITLLLTLMISTTMTLVTNDNSKADSTTETEKVTQNGDGPLIHTVYFWMNEDVTETEKAEFHEALKTLKEIDLIQQGWIGTAAPTEERGVIDSSYDFSITFIFDSVEDEAAYQIHPDHATFVEENSANWARVQVYDVIATDD